MIGNRYTMVRVSIVSKFALIFFSIYRVDSTLVPDIIPKSYELKLVPFLENSFNFAGEVNIEIQCTFSTTEILLHCGDFTISRVQVSRNGKEFTADYELLKKSNLLHIKTRDYMAYDGIYRIHIKYEGRLSDNMIGFYKSFYKIDRQTKWLAVTQFESNFARMTFPCFDEPKFRTPFTISVARYKGQVGLSNMPLKETSEEDPSINNRVWDTFQTTPPMPTYLVAVLVSDFVSVTSEDKRISVWARPNAIKDAGYIVGQSQLILEHLEAYTGIRYPLPKLDLVAVPHFKSGAMENWGLTTYRERYLLYQSEVGSAKHLEVMNLIVAHELSHQWFGDYVTPEWWSYVWLNEAFAAYFKYHVIATIEPSWRMDQFFVPDAVQTALFADEVNVHHPMTTQVKTTAEIEEIFDMIIYQKGGSILRMFEHMVSPQTFRKTLSRYLNDGKANGGTVVPDSLWNAFDRQVLQDRINLPRPPSEIMSAWTTNRGYPLITVTRAENRSLIMIEETTYKSPRSTTSIPDQNWIIPLTFAKKYSPNFGVTKPSHWVGLNSSKSLEIEVSLNDDEWIVFNKQQTGYYRVNYDLRNWNLLVNQLHTAPERIHVLNRAQLIDDSFVLAIDEKLSYNISINIANYLDNEFDPLPWFTASKHFHYLYLQYQQTAIGNLVKDFILERISNHYKRIGFQIRPNEDHLTRTSRSGIVSMACYLGYPDCILKAKKLYEKFFDELSKIPGDLKHAVYCTMLSYGNSDSVWSKLWALYETTNSTFESETVLATVGCIKDDKLITKILSKLMVDNDQDIHKQNVIYILNSLFQTSNGVTSTLNFIDNRLSKQGEPDPTVIKKLSSIVNKIHHHIKSENQIKILKKIINESNQHYNTSSVLMSVLRTMYQDGLARIQMSKRRMEEIKNAIENSVRPSPITPIPEVIPVTSKEIPSSALNLRSLVWLNVFTLVFLTINFGVITRAFI